MCVCGLDPWFLPVIMLLLDRSQPARRAHGDHGPASQGQEMQSRQKSPRRKLRRQLIPDGAGPDASAAFLGPMPGLGLRGGECMAAAGETSQAGRRCSEAVSGPVRMLRVKQAPCVPCGHVVGRGEDRPGHVRRGAVERSVLTIEVAFHLWVTSGGGKRGKLLVAVLLSMGRT
jgi:hypothetical protein